MTYSCSDFTDDIINSLNLVIPDESDDNPSDQADLAMAEIERLQAVDKVAASFTPGLAALLASFGTMPDDACRAAEHMTGMRISYGELRAVKAAMAVPAPAFDAAALSDDDLCRCLEAMRKRGWAVAAYDVAALGEGPCQDEQGDYDEASVGEYLAENREALENIMCESIWEHVSGDYQAPEAEEDMADAGQDERAAAEGWCILENEAGTVLRLTADPDSTIYCRDGVSFDDEAAEFVKAQAAAGSAYHVAALARLTPAVV